MKRVLIIQLENNVNEGDDNHDDETIVERVLELIRQGYVSGYYPSWEIKEESE
jgi:hypothetical protein